jgi:anti-sigma B factor antagonist
MQRNIGMPEYGRKQKMNISRNIVDTAVVLALDGKLNTNTSVDLENELQGLPKDMKTLVFDFKELSYLSSAGLRVLIAQQKRINAAGGAMSLRNVSGEIMEILQMTGLDDIFAIE